MQKSFQIFLLLTLGLFFSQLSIAHPGGHYHQDDIAELHQWEIKVNNIPIIGNFSMYKNEMVCIEGINGKEWTIPMKDLTETDKKYALAEINRINQLNGAPLISEETNDHYHPNYLMLIFLASLTCISFLLCYYAFSRKLITQWRLVFTSLFFISTLLFLISCKKETENIGGGSSNSIPKTSTAFLDSAFSPFKPNISTSWDTNYFYVSSAGIPNHNMMIGISSWQQQVPIPQDYTGTNHWSIPLQPVYASQPLSTRYNFMKGAVALAVNGVPIFNALNNRGEDAFTIGELDQWGGHCGKGDDYHYHAAPLNLSTSVGLKPIAFALDGFPVYGANEPDGSAMQALDTCHGHKYGNYVYHYHGTTSYPYVIGAMRGQVTIDPTTPAPENQILPQAFASPIRPALTPLRGAVITNFTAPNANAYNLTYQIGSKLGHVNYTWDNTGTFNFQFIDTGGVITTATYHR